MPPLRLVVVSLRYSSWSMRPWLALTHAGANFATETVELELERQSLGTGKDAAVAKIARGEVEERRKQGSVAGLFPVLHVAGAAIHESLAICEYVNEAFPGAQLWPEAGLARARARAISTEMATNFVNMRMNLSCHLFGRVPSFAPSAATQREIERVFELWREALERSGGLFLFGKFSIADAMFFPVRTRLRTYGVAIPVDLGSYVSALDEVPAVRALHQIAQSAPTIPAYDAYLRGLGGDPNAALQVTV
ncbi:MAG TPA: glutathione S-transferase C-terminal domain-containing protein [Polyangiaceae bacterium]|nr:glutathione S-transferase C-terminal domain-containing protein [Polyangiaceae bacterium]